MDNLTELSENHLFRLHLYLQKNLCDRPGTNVLKTELMTLNRTKIQKFGVDEKIMCPHCYCYWCEGNYRMKFWSNNSKRRKRTKIRFCRIKCLNCGKHVMILHGASASKVSKLKIEKSKIIQHQNLEHTKGNRLTQKTKEQKMLKKYQLSQNLMKKKKQENLLCRKKSSLTYLNDFL